MEKKRILVFGAQGMLGSVLVPLLKQNKNLSVITHSQTQAADAQSDLSDYNQVHKTLKDQAPHLIINLLALTDVDYCETHPQQAYKINALPVRNLARYVLENNLQTQLIQISTDHVYDQNNSSEDDLKLYNVYARTKWLADEFAQLIPSVVLRTNFFGDSLGTKKSFSTWIIESLSAAKPLEGFNDVYFSPVHISTLCREIEKSIFNFVPGIYNLGSRNGISKFEFMIKIAALKGFTKDLITPIKYSSTNNNTVRPFDMRMNVNKYENTFNMQLPTLDEELRKC